jgi:hypothetical protein
LSKLQRLAPIFLILLVAAFMRLYRLDTVPPGMYSDIATNGLDVRDIFAGHPRIFFPANNGREALFIYFQALLVAGAGYRLIVFTFASVAMGMLSVALTYRLIGALFGHRMALIAAGLMAVAMWGVALSRVGLRFSSVPPFVLVTLYLLWRTLHAGRWRYAVVGGIALGASLYTYPSARLLPLLAVFLCAFEWRLARKRWPQLGLGLLLSAAVFAPEGVYFLRHPDDLIGRAAQVSVFNPHPEVERSRDTLDQAVVKTAGMFFVHGDENRRGNIPGRPVFDPPAAAFFALGLAVALWKAREASPYRWLLLWLVVMSLPSALSQSSPDQFRIYAVAPAAFALAALGFESLARRFPSMVTRTALPALAVAWTAAWTGLLYFGVWANDPKTDEAFGGGAYRLAGYLAARPEPRMFLAFHDRWPVQLTAPKTMQAGWFREELTALPVPSTADGDVLYIAAPFAALAKDAPGIVPELEALPHSTAASGVPDFLAYRWQEAGVRRLLAGVSPLDASMGADFHLAGYNLAGARLRMLWQPLPSAAGPYDLFIHLIDASARQVAQFDALAWPAEDGPSDYLLMTQLILNVPPGRYIAEAGAVHRDPNDPSRLAGGPIGEVARIPVEVVASGG